MVNKNKSIVIFINLFVFIRNVLDQQIMSVLLVLIKAVPTEKIKFQMILRAHAKVVIMMIVHQKYVRNAITVVKYL